MKPEYIVAIDGGGSKTNGRIERISTGETWEYRGGPSSLTNNFDQALHEIRRVVITLLKNAHASPQACVVVVGVAGAGNDQLKERLIKLIEFDFHHLLITTDARISLYGARLGKPVVALALGTGSVAMCLDEQQNETIVGGWGFAIADEGSGAALGKAAIRATLWELDRYNAANSETAQYITSRIGVTRAEILNWIKQASAFDFGELVPAILLLLDRCDVARDLLGAHARDVEKLIQVARSERNLPVVLLGGLAAVTAPLLADEIQKMVILSEGNALDGAMHLARTHLTASAANL